jgi:lipopolysaccharide heptosyltransferase II
VLIRDFNPARILLIRLARLGDVILLVPAIKLLRKKFPHSHIAALVGRRCAPILEMCDAIDEVIAVDRVAMRDGSRLAAIRDIVKLAERIRRARYELVLDFHSFRETNLLAWYSRADWRLGLKRAHGSYLSFCFNLGPVLEDKSQHVASVFRSLLNPLGVEPHDEEIHLDLSAEDLSKADDLLLCHQMLPRSTLLGFNVGAGSPGRIWPKENFAELARKLILRHNAGVIFFSGPQDGDFSREVARLTNNPRTLVANNLSLRLLAAVISRCTLLVSNDTGPMHLGPATGVPTLGLFSLGHPEHYRPLGRYSRFVRRHPIEALQVEEVYEMVSEMMHAIQK